MTESSPDLLGALLQASPDAVIVVDPHGRVELVTPAVQALFGWRPDELIGQSIELLIPEDLRLGHPRLRETYTAHPHARAMGSGLDLWGQRRDGTTFAAEVSLVPLTLEGVTHVGAFVRDATERHEVEHLRLVSEEERIARDLHDTVIQRLFAIGMSLQGAEQLVAGSAADRIQAAVDAIDEVIREIRETIFDLKRPDTGGPDGRPRVITSVPEGTGS